MPSIIRRVSGVRNFPSRTARSSTTFSNGWTLPEGQHSIDTRDLVFDVTEHAGADAKWRKIIWDDGKWLSIEQSVERAHAAHPDAPRSQI
jgi:hypothetical protein